MSVSTSPGSGPTASATRGPGIVKVVFASLVGTAVEWYDFFLFGSAAALVFGEVFFGRYQATVFVLFGSPHLDREYVFVASTPVKDGLLEALARVKAVTRFIKAEVEASRSVFQFGAMVTLTMIPIVFFFMPESVHWLARATPSTRACGKRWGATLPRSPNSARARSLNRIVLAQPCPAPSTSP